MLSKVLAGVFAVAVLTVGGYAYWQYTDGTHCCGTQAPADESASATPPCCQELSRMSCPLSGTDVPTSSPVAPELLAIEPREVK